ncbi:Probable RNA-directed DNA polymerase from transposon X-element [Eumeta japonica]|uniref:Probable RNA-directed DNA polymerase from transposon X-element n=1 Tax=Eumeta variegata TaxID=151549 RepID=A0A4C1T4R7_EUMVA|nr:Probable RNA-directed DNA polymerase from transposon X-element [Eumeta japonica]
MSENSIDIALVQETYLKPNRPKACSIAGYVQLRTDRTYSSKGGTALYYRRSLHCGPINIPPLTNMEATGCRLAMTGHSTLVIVSTRLRNHRASTSTCFPHVVTHRPSTIDIALTKGVALNFNSIETIHGLTSDHRPVILKWDLRRREAYSFRKITNWKRVSTALEKIDTPNLNSIPNDIASTDEIDLAIGALTNHVRTVVEESEREVPASSDRRKFPPDILELIRAKRSFAPRERISHSRVQIQSASSQREVKARVREFRNESWSDLMEEIKPSHKAFWAVTKALKTEDIPYTPLKT